MEKAHTHDAEYRFGDHGPAYLIQGPSSDIGVLKLRPGDDMVNHIHKECDESFVIIEGEVSLYVNCSDEPVKLTTGAVARCVPHEMHYFVNESSEDMRLIFIKSPASPGDTYQIPWVPGEPPVTPTENEQ